MHELFKFRLVFDFDLLSFLHKEILLRRLRRLLEELLRLLLDVLHRVLLYHDREACLGRRRRLSQRLPSEEQSLLRHGHHHVPEDVPASLSGEGPKFVVDDPGLH